MDKILYTETQRFRQIWIIIIMIGTSGIFVWGLIQQLIFRIPWGTNPSSDLGLILFSLIPFLIFILLLRIKLLTTVKEDGVYFKFSLLQRKTKKIPKEDILKYQIRTYRPIKEYGGWGIRKGGKRVGDAYNVSGNVGVQFELKTGKKILIGTAFPERFKKAVDDMLKKG
ncbi:MAG: DUF6141 family protein [Saprospiraceae bacterium]|nr:DUF6141 family protein [Saprospiraceae bacterium]